MTLRRAIGARGHAGARLLRLLLLALVVAIVPGCNLDSAVADARGTVNDALGAIPGLVASFDKLSRDATANADAAAAHTIQTAGDQVHLEIEAIDAVLAGRIEQANGVAKDRIEQIDLALASKIRQLQLVLSDLVTQLEQLIAGTLKQLTWSADEIAARMDRTGVDVLEEAGVTVHRTLIDGTKTVAIVTERITDVVVIAVAGLMFVGLVVYAVVFFRKLAAAPGPISAARWVPGSAAFVVLGGLPTSMMFPSVREAALASRVPLGDDATVVCPPALVAADAVLAETHVAEGQVKDALLHLYQCMSSPAPHDLRVRAQSDIAAIHRRRDPRPPGGCTSNADCDAEAGEHCDLAKSACTARCNVDADCLKANTYCGTSGACLASCRVVGCPDGLKCLDGVHCVAAACTPGERRSCGVSDHPPCHLGNQTCGDRGTWDTPCVGNVDPKPEDTCVPGDDSSCDGVANNGFPSASSACKCLVGASTECTCAGRCQGLAGSQQCLSDGHALSTCGPCTCACAAGESRSCSCPGVSTCSGHQACDGNHAWGQCSCPQPGCRAPFASAAGGCELSVPSDADVVVHDASTPKGDVAPVLPVPAECAGASTCELHYKALTYSGGGCGFDATSVIQVRCVGSSPTQILRSEDFAHGDDGGERTFACHGSQVVFAKIGESRPLGGGCTRHIKNFWWRARTGTACAP